MGRTAHQAPFSFHKASSVSRVVRAPASLLQCASEHQSFTDPLFEQTFLVVRVSSFHWAKLRALLARLAPTAWEAVCASRIGARKRTNRLSLNLFLNARRNSL